MPNTLFHLLLIATLTALGISISSADAVHKCKNAEGKMLYQKTPCTENVQEVSSWTPKTAVKPQKSEPGEKTQEIIVIKQASNGHYFLEAEINSHAVTFIVDTGATTVVLPRAVARAASLFCDEEMVASTANGLAKGCTTIITELKLGKGSLVLKNVHAAIAPNLSQPLLGMNVLQAFDIQQKGGEMEISEREAK
jgi:clan AA aspartic protease (TIGR02281 family)